MKFVDEANIHIKAGDGGKGCVSFRREKYVPRGGPDGGDGGKGGDVILVGKKDLSSLLDYKYKHFYKAENGKHGSGNNKKGRDGKDIYIYLPLGTLVYDKKYPHPICDITEDRQSFIAAKGGRGGRGNTHFVTPVHRAPKEFEDGGAGEECELFLNLKLLADIGIVGLPNAGKSTLISRLTSAKPKIGDYPFTTLTPSLGVFHDGDVSIVFSDIPGIVMGASGGRGLGIKFLKHIERTRSILLVMDVSSPSVYEDYRIILNELVTYNTEMLNKSRTVLLNKIDLISEADVSRWAAFFSEKGEKTIKISALKGTGIEELKDYLRENITIQIKEGSG